MGNSEVGHLNLGCRTSCSPRISKNFRRSRRWNYILKILFYKKFVITSLNLKEKLHLIGLCSDGGVHSHLDHLFGLLDLAKLQGITEVCVHVITDGRDTNITEGVKLRSGN